MPDIHPLDHVARTRPSVPEPAPENSDEAKSPRKFRLGCWILGGFIGCLLLPTLVVAHQRTAKPAQTINMEKETTFITEPLTAAGLPDYAAAINARLSAGVTPETNSVVKLVEAIGPRPEQISMEFHEALADALGMAPLPEHGSYVVGIVHYLRELPAPPADRDEPLQELINEMSEARSRGWQTADYPDVAGWINKNEIPLQRVREALRRPHYYRPVIVTPGKAGEPGQLIAILLPDVQCYREIALLLAARAMWHLGEGRVDAAIEDLLDGHRLARKVAQGWTIIEGLVGMAIDSVTCQSSHALLIDPQLTAAQARYYREQLESLGPVMTIEQMARTIDLGERFMGLDYVTALAVGKVLKEDLELLGLQSFETVLHLIKTFGVNWNRVLSKLNQHYDQIVQAYALPERVDRLMALKELSSALREQHAQLTGWEGGIYWLLSGSGGRGEALAATLCSLLTPAAEQYHDAVDRSTMRYETLLIALALAEYHRTHGRYPAELDSLKPAFLETIPNDLYSGNPLRYRVSDDGQEMKIYSVGKNGVDDNGLREGDLDATGKRSDDIGVVDPIPQPPAEVQSEAAEGEISEPCE